MNPERKRKPTRLSGYDYSSPGFYFATICTHQRECRFRQVIDGEMHLNNAGKIAWQGWEPLSRGYPNIGIEHFVVMPNHVHGLIEIKPFDVFQHKKPHDLSEIIRGFKTWSAIRINRVQNSAGAPVWQRSFYDQIIRNEKQLQTVVDYIRMNSERWDEDKENLTVFLGD